VRKWLLRALVAVASLVIVAFMSGYGFLLWLFALEFPPVVLTPPVYVGLAGGGKVIDATTGDPVSGAIVVAWWELRCVTAFRRHLVVKEAVTDEMGNFRFDGRGPTMKRPLATFLQDDPEVLAFKPGYRFRFVSGNGGYFQSHTIGAKGTIALEPFSASRAEYATALAFPWMGFLLGEEDYLWKQTPKFIAAMDEEARLFEKQGVRHRLRTIDDRESFAAHHGCGSNKRHRRLGRSGRLDFSVVPPRLRSERQPHLVPPGVG
jgi:hypothetical protein